MERSNIFNLLDTCRSLGKENKIIQAITPYLTTDEVLFAL